MSSRPSKRVRAVAPHFCEEKLATRPTELVSSAPSFHTLTRMTSSAGHKEQSQRQETSHGAKPLNARDGKPGAAPSAVQVLAGEEFPAFDTTVISVDTARMLKTLLANLDGMVYRCRDDQDWTVEFISEGCRRLTGYDASDLLLNNRLSYESITHPDDRRRVREEIHAGLAEGQRFDAEYRIVHADGGIRWVWERGAGIYDA